LRATLVKSATAGTLKAMLLAERARAERLEQIIRELRRHRFGRRAETLPEDQLLLGLEEVEQAAASSEAAGEAVAPAERARYAVRRRMNRGSLPAHLPRIEMVVDIEDHSCPCCRNALHRMGEDRSERLDMIPAQLRVLVVRRPKYACRTCEEVVASARLIEGGLPTEATVRRSSSPNTLITCRSTANPRSTPGRASCSTARHWPTGSAAPPVCCGRCMSACSLL
jgi:transposase